MKEYILKNEYLEARFINYGASIISLVDLKTKREMVLSYDKKEMYIVNPNYFGCVVGRNAGRIEQGLIIVNDRKYQLTRNFLDKHQLHSGFNGFQTKYFQEEAGNDYIKFTSISSDMEDGFPGNVKLIVTYRLLDNELNIEYEAESDKDTIISITNHSYFNLNLDKNSNIENHHLFLNCDNYIELDEEMIPKKITPVDNTPFDFRGGKLIGKDICEKNKQLIIANGYDHPYLINKSEDINFVALLSNEDLKLEIYSTQDAVVFYAGNFLDKFRCGLCLETQGVPFFEKNIYQKKEKFYQKTIWKVIS